MGAAAKTRPMASLPPPPHKWDTPRVRQDVAPKGGYPQVNFDRRLPVRGFSNGAILGGFALLTIFGFYRTYNVQTSRRNVQLCEAERFNFRVPFMDAAFYLRTCNTNRVYAEREARLRAFEAAHASQTGH